MGPEEMFGLSSEEMKPLEASISYKWGIKQAEEECEEFNKILMPDLLKKFNKKQKAMYKLSLLKMIVIPLMGSENEMRIDWIAYGTPTSLDKRLMSRTMEIDRSKFGEFITHLVTHTMRYGLKHVYIEGEEISEDAYL
jgi:hypothetical protein